MENMEKKVREFRNFVNSKVVVTEDIKVLKEDLRKK